MGPDGAAKILHRRQLAAAGDPDQLLRTLSEQYTREHLHPLHAAESGYVDDVIDPADTRRVLVRYLQLLSDKSPTQVLRKHSTMPL